MGQENRELTEEEVALIYKIARYVTRRIPVHGHVYDREDFIQIAVTAGMLAARRYKEDKGASLFTYLCPCMRGAVLDEVRKYMHGKKNMNKKKVQIFKDHEVTRFSQLFHGRDSEYVESLFSAPASEYTRDEVIDELLKWKRESDVSPREWFMLVLRLGEKLTHKEIAKVLDIHEARVGQILSLIYRRVGIKPPPSCIPILHSVMHTPHSKNKKKYRHIAG